MELRLRKKIINSLPKFDPGKSTVPNENANFQPFWQRRMNYNDKASPLYVKNPGTITPRTNDHLERNQQDLQADSSLPLTLLLGLNFTGDVLKAFGPVKSEKEMLSDAGNGTGTIMGVGYETQNSINSEAQLELLNAENTSNTLSAASSGAAFGNSILPGIGGIAGGLIGGIAGIFGSSRRKRKLREKILNANLLAQRTNMFNRTSAMSGAMEQNWALLHSNTQDDILYANRGKDLKQPKYNRL